MTTILVITQDPFQTRAALLRNDTPIRFAGSPFASDSHAGGPFVGDQFGVRILTHPAGVNGAIVDMGGSDGLLTRPKALTDQQFRSQYPEGALVAAQLQTPTRPDKRPRLRLLDTDAARVGLIGESDGWLRQLCVGWDVPNPQTVITDAVHLIPRIKALWPGVDVQHHTHKTPLFVHTGVADDYADALAPVIPLPSGGQVLWQPTAAGHTFDVDAQGGNKRNANREGITAILRFIERTGAEGLMILGLIPDPKDHKHLTGMLRKSDLGLQVGRVDQHGVISMSRKRVGLALDECLFMPSGLGVVIKSAAVAATAYRQAAAELAADATTPVQLRLGQGLFAHFVSIDVPVMLRVQLDESLDPMAHTVTRHMP